MGQCRLIIQILRARYAKKGDLVGAIEQYEKALKLAPKDDAILKQLSQLLHRYGLEQAGERGVGQGAYVL